MKKYEVIILFKNNKNQETFIKKIKQRNFYFKIKTLGFKKLAYSINKIFLAKYTRFIIKTNKSEIENLNIFLSKNKLIIRYLTIKKKKFFIKINKKKIFIDFLEKDFMSNFLDENFKIMSKKNTFLNKKDQKIISKFIKISRFLSVIPYV